MLGVLMDFELHGNGSGRNLGLPMRVIWLCTSPFVVAVDIQIATTIHAVPATLVVHQATGTGGCTDVAFRRAHHGAVEDSGVGVIFIARPEDAGAVHVEVQGTAGTEGIGVGSIHDNFLRGIKDEAFGGDAAIAVRLVMAV